MSVTNETHVSPPGVRKDYRSARRTEGPRPPRGETNVKRELLINVGDFETRIALLEDDRLVELSVERPETERMVGDIYKGRISKVLPGMQSAFVDIGWEKAAFLHASDMGHVPDSQRRYDVEDEGNGEIIRKNRRVGIEKVLKDRQELLVQVIKEPIGTKGPRISTDISIPGRYVVLVPDNTGVRVSKKISEWAEVRRLRKVVEPLRPEGFGLICRTESQGKGEKEIVPDIKRSLRMWTKLKRKGDSSEAPALIHKEEEMIISVVRDILTDSMDKIVVDSRREYRRLAAYSRQVTPQLRGRIELYNESTPLFDKYNVEREIEKMLERKVWIRKGSYLVIDQTEAMITIDVNTGRFVGSKNQEETIFRTNMESCKEIARQLRLRDMGGLIVCDFIDMYSRENRRKLYESFKRELEKDRAKKAVNPVSDFGLIELTRQRVRPSLMQTFSEPCSCCNGFGRVLSKETMGAKIDRWFIRASAAKEYASFHLVVNPSLADALIGQEGDAGNRLRRIMKQQRIKVNLVRDTSISLQEFRVFEAESNREITNVYH
ncbi:MAG: ribonuclease E/G [Candidatus Zixiibacteriota bacterium]